MHDVQLTKKCYTALGTETYATCHHCTDSITLQGGKAEAIPQLSSMGWVQDHKGRLYCERCQHHAIACTAAAKIVAGTWERITQGGVPVLRRKYTNTAGSAWTCERTATITPSENSSRFRITVFDDEGESHFSNLADSVAQAKRIANKFCK